MASNYSAPQWRRLIAWCKANEAQIAKHGFAATLERARSVNASPGWTRLERLKPDRDDLEQALHHAGIFAP